MKPLPARTFSSCSAVHAPHLGRLARRTRPQPQRRSRRRRLGRPGGVDRLAGRRSARRPATTSAARTSVALTLPPAAARYHRRRTRPTATTSSPVSRSRSAARRPGPNQHTGTESAGPSSRATVTSKRTSTSPESSSVTRGGLDSRPHTIATFTVDLLHVRPRRGSVPSEAAGAARPVGAGCSDLTQGV